MKLTILALVGSLFIPLHSECGVPFLGVHVRDDAGTLLITHVYSGTPAMNAQLERGQRIIQVNGTPATRAVLSDAIIKSNAKKPIHLWILKDSITFHISIVPELRSVQVGTRSRDAEIQKIKRVERTLSAKAHRDGNLE